MIFGADWKLRFPASNHFCVISMDWPYTSFFLGCDLGCSRASWVKPRMLFCTLGCSDFVWPYERDLHLSYEAGFCADRKLATSTNDRRKNIIRKSTKNVTKPEHTKPAFLRKHPGAAQPRMHAVHRTPKPRMLLGCILHPKTHKKKASHNNQNRGFN